ncbi:MAG: peptidoglycan-binding protein [Leptolyngbyaceae cyanobacterium]
MVIKPEDLFCQPEGQTSNIQGLETKIKISDLNIGLRKIVGVSAGCALLTGLSNAQPLNVYACENIEDETRGIDCHSDKLAMLDTEVQTSNSPSVAQNLEVQWSTSSANNDSAINVSDNASVGSENTADTLEPLPASTRIYGNVIELSKSPLWSNSNSLGLGDQGDKVSELQEKLNEAGIATAVDGIFGEATQKAVMEFQASQGLPQDGVVGPQTSTALFGAATPLTTDIEVSGVGVRNTATASSVETDFVDDSENVPVSSSPGLSINKSVVEVLNPDGSTAVEGTVDEPGDIIKYSIRVRNVGNITLTGVTVDDPITGGALAINQTFEVGDEQTFEASHTVTQSDIDTYSSIENEATAISDQTDLKSDSEAVPVRQIPALKVSKEAVGVDVKNDEILNKSGDLIEYVIVVENTGNQTLTDVVVNDPQLGNSRINDLAPGEVQSFTSKYSLSQTDIDTNGGGDGDVDNVVEVTTAQTDPARDFEEVPISQNPDIQVEKRTLSIDESGDGVLNNAGETVTYEVVITNTGNQTLNNVSIEDSLLSVWIVRDLTLAPGASESYTYTYEVTQGDLDRNVLAMK